MGRDAKIKAQRRAYTSKGQMFDGQSAEEVFRQGIMNPENPAQRPTCIDCGGPPASYGFLWCPEAEMRKMLEPLLAGAPLKSVESMFGSKIEKIGGWVVKCLLRASMRYQSGTFDHNLVPVSHKFGGGSVYRLDTIFFCERCGAEGERKVARLMPDWIELEMHRGPGKDKGFSSMPDSLERRGPRGGDLVKAPLIDVVGQPIPPVKVPYLN